MKKLFQVLFITFTLVCIITFSASAEKTVTVGWCGDNLVWSFDSETEVLSITGTGDMIDYSKEPTPWRNIRSLIKEVQIGDGVTNISGFAFSYCSNLEYVRISNTVTSIGEFAFVNCYKLTSIEIPDSVNIIGERAFQDCQELASVKIGSGVTNIGDRVFEMCDNLSNISVSETNQFYSADTYGVLFNKDKTALIQYPRGSSVTEYTIPNSVMNIVKGAFDRCSNLQYIEILDGFVTISDGAFEYCTSLTSIKIPNSVTSIGNDAFAYCKNLTKIKLPDIMTNIGECAFAGCSKITSIDIPSGITRINKSTFSNCDGLTGLTIPDSVNSIGVGAFYSCDELASVKIGNSVVSIGDDAFEHCESLTSIAIPDSVNSIGENAFFNCGLASVKIGSGVTSIGNEAFGYCWNLENIHVSENNKAYSSNQEGVLLNKDKTLIILYPTGNSRTEYKVPEGVANIGDYAFAHAGKLKSVEISDSVTNIGEGAFAVSGINNVTISDSVTSIGNNAFGSCSNLKSISVANNNQNYSNDEYGVLFNKDKTLLIQYPVGNNRTEYIIPNSVIDIGSRAFSDCYRLTNVEIGDNVTGIDDRAFKGCGNLVSVKIGNNVTNVGDLAFGFCRKLTSIEIPDSVNIIGEQAFYDCDELASVKIGSGVTDIGNQAFCECNNLAEIEIPGNVTNINGAFNIYLEKIIIYNPNCIISGLWTRTTIYGYVNSTAYDYAKTFNMKFIALTCLHEDIVTYNVEPATCVNSGITAGTYCNFCKTWIIERKFISALGHNYVDGVCTNCGDSKIEDCSCNCHKNGIKGFLFKFILFFQKIFKLNKECKCGIVHY